MCKSIIFVHKDCHKYHELRRQLVLCDRLITSRHGSTLSAEHCDNYIEAVEFEDPKTNPKLPLECPTCREHRKDRASRLPRRALKFARCKAELDENGGGSWSPSTGVSMSWSSGFTVGGFSTSFIGTKSFKTMTPAEVATNFADYAAANAHVFDEKRNRYIGAWVDEDKLYIDVSEYITNEVKAACVSILHDEIAYFDPVEFVTITNKEIKAAMRKEMKSQRPNAIKGHPSPRSRSRSRSGSPAYSISPRGSKSPPGTPMQLDTPSSPGRVSKKKKLTSVSPTSSTGSSQNSPTKRKGESLEKTPKF